VSNALSYIGCSLTWSDFDDATGKPATAKELERITDERHDIVHRGRLPYVKRDLAVETLTPIAAMAKLIDGKVCSLYP
jgi:hypothetical protein